MHFRTPEPVDLKRQEWIPPMSRKSRALVLCIFSTLFAAILEVLDILVAKNQGISTHDTHLVFVIRYFPTAGTIALGFIWKAIVGDVKMILPWSLMSAGWAKPVDSITLNYINSIDIAAVITATKRKHWVMVLVLTVGFLTGLSVAIANILTYTEPTVSTISVEFKCERLIVWSPMYQGPLSRGSPGTLFGANNTNHSSLDCQNPFWQHRPGTDERDLYNKRSTFGWTNVTECSNNMKQIVATIATTSSDTDTIDVTTGLICNTTYTIQDSSVQVDASSGDIADYTILSDPMPIDISLPTETEWIYLNNPTDSRFQTLNDVQITQVSMNTVFHAVEELASPYNDDPFFTMLTNGQLDAAVHTYINNTDRFQNDVENLARNILVQLINTIGRANDSQGIPGTIIISGPRLFIQGTALRGLQILSLVVCITYLLVSSLLRPSSCLSENPASGAATAVILAASDTGTEAFFARLNFLSDKGIIRSISESQFKLSFDRRPCVEMETLSLMSTDTSTPVGDNPAHIEIQNNKGWRPLALRAWGKWATISVLCGVMTTLAILQFLSTKNTGLISSSSTAQATLGYSTTFILLTLSWTCSGIDASVKSLNSYNSLRDLSRRRSLLLKSKDSLIFDELQELFESCRSQCIFFTS